jgi:hypothetical protein
MELAISLTFKLGGLKTSMIFTLVLNLLLQFVIPCLIYLSLLHWNLKIPEGGFDAKKEEMAVEEYREVKREISDHTTPLN